MDNIVHLWLQFQINIYTEIDVLIVKQFKLSL